MFKFQILCFLLLILNQLSSESLSGDNHRRYRKLQRRRHNDELKLKKIQLIQDLKKLKKQEGAVKLVGGRGIFEGNVEILHNGKWGSICDDEWDQNEANVVCRQLDYGAAESATYGSTFGLAKRRYWMDNIYCDGSEKELSSCRFDGWGHHDCTIEESAGVICKVSENSKLVAAKQIKIKKRLPKQTFPANVEVRLVNGRSSQEGRVEVKLNNSWQVVCGDSWSLLEAMVICRQSNLGYASEAIVSDFFGGNSTSPEVISGIRCSGDEPSLSQCVHDQVSYCPGSGNAVAGVICVDKMADLVLDHMEIMQTAHLEDRQMFFLQCAMEENCLSSQAYKIQQEMTNWHLETRRLLKFTARTLNAGSDEFRPIIPKHLWEWHMCHMHYHSMEVFATFDIYNTAGKRVAEGHKASFCLEDNQCLPGVEPKYACANYGDQGISVNCTDIYKFSVDCQWVDISELEPGFYTLKVVVNPEFKIPEITYSNNAAVCMFEYRETGGRVYNCTTSHPQDIFYKK